MVPLLGLALLVSAGWTAVPPPFAAAARRLPACPGGVLTAAKFKFGDSAYREAYTLVVFNDGYKTVRAAAAALLRRGLIPVGILNGGFFARDESAILSYFRSGAMGNALPHNSRRSPRACMVFLPPADWSLRQSTPEDYAIFGTLPDAEIYCAGPQLLEEGRDVSARRLCEEGIIPSCRPDRSEPGINFAGDVPRSASCVTRAGDLMFFSANSAAAKCGMTGPALARAMAAEGCRFGMNHDGGGSAKLFLWDMRGHPVVLAGAGEDRLRASPVWVAVVRRRR